MLDNSPTLLDTLKRLPAETAARLRFTASTRQADPPSSNFGATRLDALLPSILDQAFKGEL
jgi:hypothetical protein